MIITILRTHRTILVGFGGALLAFCSLGTARIASGDEEKSSAASSIPEAPPYEPKTKAELRRTLSKMQYHVTQEAGTEKAFSNLYWNNKRDGIYACVVCKMPVFDSSTKYKSGTGWPSFWKPISEKNVETKTDWKLFYPRTEVHCRRCKAHLGHVFNDGPRPTGLRYCMNSAALSFEERKQNKESDSGDEGGS